VVAGGGQEQKVVVEPLQQLGICCLAIRQEAAVSSLTHQAISFGFCILKLFDRNKKILRKKAEKGFSDASQFSDSQFIRA
jgi:hypothetical protein